jgi:hypothetical protein
MPGRGVLGCFARRAATRAPDPIRYGVPDEVETFGNLGVDALFRQSLLLAMRLQVL